MTTERGEWLALLEAELARRTARVAWEADEDERRRQWVLDELQAMAGRLAATAHLYPIAIELPGSSLRCHTLAGSLVRRRTSVRVTVIEQCASTGLSP
jgi:hypothetical protein